MRRLSGIPKARVATHGDFTASAATSQAIKTALAGSPRWNFLSSAHREALEMIAFKMARIVCGDADHLDHWSDIGGYAQLGGRVCKAKPRGKRNA